jgi:hypothetical protein
MIETKQDLLEAEDWLINHCVMRLRFRFKNDSEALARVREMELDIRRNILPYLSKLVQSG